MIPLFALGFIFGIVCMLIVQYLLFLNPFAPSEEEENIPRNYSQYRIPTSLKNLLTDPTRLKKKENCVALNFILQFLYQELKDSRTLRRWMLMNIQKEFNSLVCRSGVRRVLCDIQIRELDLGTQVPIFKDIHVDNVMLGDDGDSISEVECELTVDYRGGFRLSVDVLAMAGRKASLSVNMTRLIGQLKLNLTRKPFTHWSIAFNANPTIDFKVDSKFDGRPIPRLVPLIIQQIRRAIKRKHVLPSRKLRFKPFFVNHLLQPTPHPSQFKFITPVGLINIDILSCSRLNLSGFTLSDMANMQLSVHVSIGSKPFAKGTNCAHFATHLVKMTSGPNQTNGMILVKTGVPEKAGQQFVIVAQLSHESIAYENGFRVGDILLAVNNAIITNQRLALKMITDPTIGEITVVVERRLGEDEDLPVDNANDENDDIMAEMIEHEERISLAEDEAANRSAKSSITKHKSEENLILLDGEREWEFASRKVTHCSSAPDLTDLTPLIQEQTSSTSGGYDDINTSTHRDSMSSQDEPVGASKLKRIAIKATTTGVNMAQKWNSGKATVHGILNTYQPTRRWLREQPAEIGSDAASMTSSKSTSIDKSTDNSCKQAENQDLTSPPGSIDLNYAPETKQTKPISMKTNPSINESFEFGLSDQSKYIGISLWATNNNNTIPPAMLGQTHILVGQVLDDCSRTLSKFHQQTFALKPVGQSLTAPSPYEYMDGMNGFDANLCYGDITIGFVWSPTGIQTRLSPIESPVVETDDLIDDHGTTELPLVHNWVACHFSGQSVFCACCQRKIWLKSAVQCSVCSCICHKKCQSTADEMLSCPFIAPPLPLTQISNTSNSSINKPILEEKLAPPSPSPSESPAKSYVPFTQRLSSRFKGKFKNKAETTNALEQASKDVTTAFNVRFTHDGIQPLNLGDKSMSDEQVINAAKQLGRNLFSEFPLVERKQKINDQIDKLREEIDSATNVRQSLLNQPREAEFSTHRTSLMETIRKLDEEIESSAVLMLHYCAGLQQCNEEEKNEELQKEEQGIMQEKKEHGNNPIENVENPKILVEQVPQISDEEIEEIVEV